ncbi:MAG: hypothetical protein ACQETJ_08690 [Bacteroidota bacterium]
MKKSIFTVLILYTLQISLGFSGLHAQETEIDTTVQVTSESALKAPFVYLDCRRCDFDLIRTDMTFVNYVRDPELADIHVFVTDEQTGGGSREYQFTFIGKRNFEGLEHTLKHIIDRDATLDERRNALKKYVKMGIVSFILKTPLGTHFKIEYEGTGTDQLLQEVTDPWNNWVFEAYIGRVSFDLESNQSELNSRWGFFADRVTEEWKLRIRPYFNYGRIKIQTTENEEPVISEQRRHGLDSYAIKSLNDHWSAGIFGDYLTHNGRNIRHEIMFSPGIEYSIFPYEVATRRSITFSYQIGYGYVDYFEETIYNKTTENLFNQKIEGVVNIQQPWGSIETGLEGSHYLHDFARRRIEFYGQTSVRLFEGFSLTFQAEYDVVQDQLSLPKGEASLEEVLLKQRELATDFSFSTSIAITYTFGSQYANIVNTRF